MRFCTSCGEPLNKAVDASVVPLADQMDEGGARTGRSARGRSVVVPVCLLLVTAVVVTTLVVRHGSRPSGAAQAASAPTVATPASIAAGAPSAAAPRLTAAGAIARALSEDSGQVSSLDGSWVAQISSKRVGLVVDGITYDQEAILDDFHRSRVRFPQAVLLESDRFVTFTSPGFYVTVIAIPFTTAAQANAWCARQSLPVDGCFAKRLSSVRGSGATVVHR